MSPKPAESADPAPAKRAKKRVSQVDRTAAARRGMIEAAIESFALNGYVNTTLTGVGQQAGYSRGLADYHFKSKANLADAAVALIREQAVERLFMPAVVQPSGLESILAFFDSYVQALSRNHYVRALLVLMNESLTSAPELRPLMAELNSSFRNNLSGFVEEGIADGSVRDDVIPYDVALVLESYLRGASLHWYVDPKGIKLKHIAQAADAYIVRSLGSERSIAERK